MNGKKVALGIALVAFAALNGYALFHDGMAGLVALLRSTNAWNLVLAADLVISLVLIGSWMLGDAKRRGAAVLPYLVVTFTTGSFGPLLYLLRRRDEAEAR